MLINILLTVLCGALAILFFKIKISKFWELRGVPYIKPNGLSGNLKDVGKTKHMCQVMKEYYDALKGKFPIGGIFFSLQPVAIATDLEFVKNVMIKDFNVFQDRGVYFNKRTDPLSAHLFAISGPQWRKLRTKLTPTFTSGKMKMMYPTIVDVCDRLHKHLNDQLEKTSELEMKDIVARFTTDVIGSCAFGIECNTINGENDDFREKGQKVFDTPRHSQALVFILIAFRKYAQTLGIKHLSDDVSAFFSRMAEDTIRYRESNDVHRNDFMQLMLEMKRGKNADFKITQEEINAQAFVFFVAGFETSSTLLTFCLYELCCNPDIQQKARESANDLYEKCDGKITYEALSQNHYLEQVLNETLRKYPPVPNLFRLAETDYLIPGTKVTLNQGTLVCVPIFAIQRDPDIYPDPEKFDPERFTPEATKNRHPCAFMPFGEGPRICIGLRFGMLQTKIALAMLLRHFEFSFSPKCQVPCILRPQSLFVSPIGGMWLKVNPIENSNS